MYIKSIVIDGFKSYAQRTEINGFDPLFNAITGLNGSGKSNILDSICFLLGISNLSQVRATNLQELVYKNGQAGVTKATVSIVFDNHDKKQTPLGYEQYDEITVTRQVVIGGRNKYLINGNNANNTRVQDLFRSVQLNINNPHFLIMQGRITKVLNMKPPEILSMIEEAAGTRLYESKKEMAQKTIEKKDARLNEIDMILKEEITPTLTRLKEERSSYLEYQKVIRELEHLNKLYIAYQFTCSQETSQKCAEELLQMQETAHKLTARLEEIEGQVGELDKVIAELEKKRDQEAGGVMGKLEGAMAEKQKEEAKANSNVASKKDTLKAENKKLTQLKKQMQNDETTLTAKEKEMSKLGSSYEGQEKQFATDEEAHTAAQKHFHAISAGLSSNTDGEDASLNDQLMSAKKEVSNAETEKKQAEMKLKHGNAEIKRKQAELKKTEASYKKDEQNNNAVKQNMKKLKAELDKLGYEEGKEETLQTQRQQLTQEVRTLRHTADALEARFPQLQFNYKDPEKNFDRSKVFGQVAKLIQVKDVKAATALEVAAGGKLYNVVVDTEVTGKKILQKGELKRRYTIIPLNKISARAIDQNTVRRAEQLVGKGNAQTALSLVGYERDLQKAMEYVFGTTFVCSTMDTAKKVTFDNQIMKKSVTLDGESFDPVGTLSGGSRAQTGSILAKLSELSEAHTKLQTREKELHSLEEELGSMRRVADKFRQLKQQYELKLHEAELLEERLKQNAHHQQMEELENIQKDLEAQQVLAKDSTERAKQAASKASELEYKLKNAKQLREKEMKEAEKHLKDAKTKMDKSRKAMKERQQEADSVKLEMEELHKDVEKCKEEIEVLESTIGELEIQLKQLSESQAASKAAVKEALASVNKQKDLLKSCNQDISKKVSEQKALHKESTATQLEVQEIEHKVSKCNKDAKDAARQVEGLLQKYSWIAEEKKYFGQANTAYDFEATNPKEAGRRMEKLQGTKEKLSKCVNMRAMSMLGKAEEQYNDLMRKRRVVLNDKAKIAEVIAELDEKKNEALKKAYVQVNKDFGSIFSTLLPGTQAKLVAPDGCTLLDGLEVKVAFGHVWKDSLGELSGGQRSLVALSLILAMLLFKPAPLYILDEVDAALDLSHTQNIGQMLRTHFTHSQFIVVSLKDGMFNNANVLYKTRFVDGVSTVTRYTQTQPKNVLSNSNGSNRGNQQAGQNKKATKRPRRDESSLQD